VSSIEFDKDQEFFAIAGVTKRIKIYAYNNVLKVRNILLIRFIIAIDRNLLKIKILEVINKN
jgi:hypothetical protein